MNDFFEKELANRDKFNNSLLGLLEKHRVNIPDEVLKSSPVPIANTAAFFLEITEDFSDHPWIHGYLQQMPSQGDILEDFKLGKIVVVRGLGDILDLDPQLFSYNNMKNTEEGKHDAECM
jgi:hypothetical protein